MNTLELRKIVQIGSSEGPIAAVVGSADPTRPVVLRFAFWLPAPKPYKRCAGDTAVPNAFAFEVQALRDGAIVEHVQEFRFPEQPSVEEMRRRLLPVWEALTADALGFVPNGAPQDHVPKLSLQFTAVGQ